MTWWHWAVVIFLALSVYYLEKIRDLLSWLMLLKAHQDPHNAVSENFLKEHTARVKLQGAHPFTWRLIRWWRQ